MKEKAIGKIIGGLLICLMVGLVFGGLIDTTSATTEKTTVSVTESSPWFTKGSNSGHPEYWHSHTYQGHNYISTYVGGMSGNPSQPDSWAEFKPYLSQSGKYEVYAHFYACKDTSTKVPFTVKYDGGSTTISVNQYSYSPAWKEKYLGTWNFVAGSSTYVMVTDATGEPYDGIKGLTIGTIKFVKINQPPTCTLSADQKSGNVPLTVTFTMTANDPDGSISSWVLDVDGDGNADYSGSGNPPSTQQHTYTTLGSYSVMLVVSDNDGETDFDTETVIVGENDPPTCSLSANPISGKAPLTVTFTMTANDPDGSITAWVLRPGDGSPDYSGSGSPPSTQTHTYQNEGNYNALLMVSDNEDATDSDAETINVGPPNQKPTCTLSADQKSGNAPLTVTFTMTANDPDGSISSWVLDVDGDGNADYSGSGNPPSTQQHTYQNPGDYTAKLTVTDNDRTEGYCEETITVSEAPSQPLLCTTPDPPSHNFGSVPEEEITFWSFDITNCGGGTLTWTVSDDRAWITVNPLSGSTTTGIDTVTVTINTAGLSVGIHAGHVTVNSNDGSKTGTIMVNIQPSQPLIADAGGPYYGNTNEPIQFHGSATGGTPPYTYAWDFDINGVIDSVLQNPTHSWSSTGTYYPTLKVVDDKGGWSELDVCTVLIKTPPSYNGDLIGVHPQPHYSIGEIINIGVDIKNTGNTVETYDLHLVVHDKHDTPVHDDTIDSIYLSAGAEKSEKFSATSLPVGHYSFIASLSSSSSGKVYDDIQGNFRYSNFDAVMVEQKDAEPLKRAALDEVDAMVIVTSNTMLDMISGLSWEVVKGIFEGKIKEIIENFDLFQGVLDQIYNKLGAIIDEFGVEEKLESKLYDAYKGYTATEEIKIFEQDDSFDAFIMNREFERDDKIIQAFKLGESVIREIMESGEIQKQRDRYEDLERLDESWWTFEIPKIGMVGTAFGMVASLPYTASEVTIEHSSILDSIKGLIRQQGSSGVSVLSISTDSQTVVGKETKFSITVDKKVSRTSEPIISVVISPDGRVIDMDLYKTNPYSNYETLSSGSIRLPHQPGKYKILAMTYGDMMKSSVKQVETTQTAPNILVSISTDKQFYNSSEIVTINATFINTGLEKIGNLTYSVNIQNTTHNKTGFLEIDASSTKIETLSFVPQTNGTYKAIVSLFIELYFLDFAETGFTVENGTGVSVNIDSEELYDPNTNVTANLTIENIGTETYTGNAEISTVDTLNDYFEVYNAIESLSVNVSEEKVLQCAILPKGSATPGIYRSYVTIDESTYIIPFTVAANGTIFITVQTDKLIYLASESVNVNISVKDVAFNATNATLNMSLTDPYGNKDYFVVTCSNGNYSAIITPDHKSVNGTYTILVNGTKEDYRVYSDKTFFIVNERTGLRCDIPSVIQLNTTDTINLFVETDTNLSLKDAFVTLTGCGFNGTRTTDDIGLVVFGTSSMNKTGVINVSIEKGGYGSLIGKMEVIYKKQPPIASFTYSPEKPVVNQTITFNASTSTDPDGNITKYDWNFGDGNITNTTEEIINHTYSLAGEYIVNLTVTDNDGAMNTTEKTIIVYLTVPPEITFFAPPPQVNDTICTWRTFNVTVNQTVNVSWYLNDTLQHTNESVREAKCTLHAAVAGEHNVTANASNANGTDMQT